MAIRTDLALEVATEEVVGKGIVKTKRGDVFDITEILVDDDESGSVINKKKGIYITLENDTLSSISDEYKSMTEELSEELKRFIGGFSHVMVVGLGNDDITPDALGPEVASGIIATRHLKREGIDDDFISSLTEVSVLVSGVLGTTGIESAEIVKAVCEDIRPDAIVVIDALACSELSRLGKTIQISNAGISPGSGVDNKRKELSEATLGVPVIAIGVPTIVDMHTVYENISGKEADENIPDMMVTPKDIDSIISDASRMISVAVNLALQPSLDFEDVMEYTHR